MFNDWKSETNRYVLKHLDRKPYAALSDELDGDIALLSDAYVSVLLENGVIDRDGNQTDADFDEDDLLEAMLDRMLEAHPGMSDARIVLLAALTDTYLALVRESSEDL